ncbi:TIGR02611 family protein [Sediminivirga luteola]|uniref:TIGR02611 family protein n=1 Tax=Sediminivirga luteola TaxID=1774748 RepID=A0A8J2TYV5_9MICO|nr:TIGR02611 family protein [Sediminivirga luteola]MCI2264191.1 TIGR02611 family protein [Sediminivirga luteola]GGA17467.1 hypothetical protein GCM10011333_20720 [Sediminivirga luteola]
MEAHPRPRRRPPRLYRLSRLQALRARERVRANRHVDRGYRALIGVLGGCIVVLGLIMVPLPGPGWLVVIAGIALISTEFHWARRLLRFTRRKVLAWGRWVAAQPLWVRGVLGLGTFLFVSAVVYGLLLVTRLHESFLPAGLLPEWTGL